jgi:hypothetical protein
MYMFETKFVPSEASWQSLVIAFPTCAAFLPTQKQQPLRLLEWKAI